MKRSTTTFIVCIAIVLAPTIGSVDVAGEVYPVLVWDSEPYFFVGSEFTVTFTCFSDSNKTIQIDIWLDDIDLEWSLNASYFVNREVVIRTDDQLSGLDHKLEVIATDYLSRVATLVSIFAIDSIDPVFNELRVFPYDGTKVTFDKTTQVMFEWNITDDYFFEFRIYKGDESLILVSPDLTGSWNYTFFSMTPKTFVFKCVAIDKANNTAEILFDAEFIVAEDEYVPQSVVDALIESQRKERVMALVAALFAVIVIAAIFIAFAAVLAKRKKELNL